MPHVTGDRVKDTTTTTGTGNITVSGTAPTGFRTLSTVATADGDTLFLAIVGGSEWEVCLATRVSANVYTRTTILESSNSNAAVNFAAGTKDVFITKAASESAWLIGGTDRAAPTAQTWTNQGVLAGTSNTSAANLTWNLSSPTGTGTAGQLAIASSFSSPTAAATTVTMTIATPCVVTHSAHGYVTGQPVVFTTTGALPTGIVAGTTYYVVSIASSTTTYNLATSVANAIAGTLIATSGSQSGTHTCTTLATVQNPDITAITVGPSGLTGSQTTPLLDLRQTWNTSGSARGLRLNVSTISSNGLLVDVQRNGVSRFNVSPAGKITIKGDDNLGSEILGTSEFRTGSLNIGWLGNGGIYGGDGGGGTIYGGIDSRGVVIQSGMYFALTSGNAALTPDTIIRRDAANTFAQRNGASAQVSRIYRTFTDASNYERLALQSGAGYFEVAAETAGTGTDNLDLRLVPAGTGDVIIGSSTSDISLKLGVGAGKAEILSGSYTLSFLIDGGSRGSINNAGDWSPLTHLRLASANSLIWNSDTYLNRDAANTLAQRNGATAQVSRIYHTYTDSSNYERMALQSGSGYFEVAAQTAGTGTDDLSLRLTAAGAAGKVEGWTGSTPKGAASTTVTMTIATPCVVTWTAHGFGLGQQVVFTTTGALPTGVVAGTTYFVVPTGANTFNISATAADADAGTLIASSGSQSGTHTGTTTAIPTPTMPSLKLGPHSLVGSETAPLLDLKQTHNTTGVATVFKLNAAGPAMGFNALLMDLQRNGTSQFKVNNGGDVTVTNRLLSPDVRVTLNFHVNSDSATAGLYLGTGFDVPFVRDAAGVSARRNSTTAQTDRVYRTYTDASNYERLALQSGSGYFEVAAETAGTGTDNLDLRLTAAGTGKVTAASAITANSGTAIPAGGTAGAGVMVSSTANFGMFFGSGAPTLSAAKGSLYLRSDGSTTNDRAYINTDGSTTWTALTTAA